MPVFWVEQIYRLPQNYATELIIGLKVPLVVRCLSIVLIVAGLLMIFWKKALSALTRACVSQEKASEKDENGNQVSASCKESKPLMTVEKSVNS